MTQFKEAMPSNLYEILERCGIASRKQILIMSVWDIQKMTHLKMNDIIMLKKIGATCAKIKIENILLSSERYVTTGLLQLDNHFKGGFRCGTITEIFGESGSGKTQLCLHFSIHNWQSGVVYICTEDVFPVKRFEQMKLSLLENENIPDIGKNIFIEHVTEASELMSCIRVRLPKLLSTEYRPSLIIIDSIAAPFRSDSTNYIQRAADLRELAMKLIELAKTKELAIISINQVTSSIDLDSQLIPSLGLAWSNMISTRISVKKTMKYFANKEKYKYYNFNKENCSDIVPIRELSIIFSPDLQNQKHEFVVLSSGVQYLCKL